MTLGKKIHQLRKEKGLSQEELAAHLTVSRQAISKWELDESMPDTENVLQLSKIFNVSTDFLLNDDFESDKDIPAVKLNTEIIQADNKRKFKITGLCMMGVGITGVLVLLILMSIIPAYRMVTHSAPRSATQEWVGTPYQPYIVGIPDDLPEDEMVYWGSFVRVTGHLDVFLETYNLTWLFTLCCMLTGAGLILLLHAFGICKRKNSKHLSA